MIKTIFTTAFVAFFTLVGPAFAGDPVYTGTFNNKAIQGYDTVSYFSADKPVKGSKEFQTSWRGANWYFSSADNLKTFKADPEKYAPQYGGYCAWAVAHGTLAKGDAKIWAVVEGKLYLNYDASIQKKWIPRKAELIVKADTEYHDLVDLN